MSTITGSLATKKKSLPEATSGETLIANVWVCLFGVLAAAGFLWSDSEQLVAAINTSALW
jgi:hypothetical protein